MEFKGSRTEANLLAAFAGESQARNKYTFYEQKAKQDGYEQIAAIFKETANNERAHAKMWFDLFKGIKSTEENLKDAAAGEHFEWSEMYAEFSKVAKEEGFDDISFWFEKVGEIEKDHDERYTKLIKNIEGGLVFKKSEVVVWKCRNCGHIHTAVAAPEICPVCKHPKAYFEINCKNY